MLTNRKSNGLHKDLPSVMQDANTLVENFYNHGKTLTGVRLKNYTSGDGKNLGFEGLLSKVIALVVDSLDMQHRVRVDGRYFNPPQSLIEKYDPQRLDFHVWKDGKAILLIESRAWVDKPFYTLKRAVIRNMMKLDYVRDQLDDEVEFLVVALAIDIKDRLVTTMNETMGYGNRISQIKLSPYRRNHKKKNYFYFGHVKESVDTLVSLLYNKLSD